MNIVKDISNLKTNEPIKQNSIMQLACQGNVSGVVPTQNSLKEL